MFHVKHESVARGLFHVKPMVLSVLICGGVSLRLFWFGQDKRAFPNSI